MRKLHLLTASVIALSVSVPALAQESAQSDPAATTEETETYDSEIVVTAQGRTQVAQDVPIAVAVIDSASIERAGISDVRGLRQLTPSLQTTTGQSSATGVVLSIRGIGTAGDNPGFEPAVGVFIDGVFRARAGLALAEMPELERVEVLRGPQGTLFGRNTSAGALNIITARPKFEFGGYGEVSYGNYSEIEAKAGLNIPAGEQLAFRVDGGYHKRDGYATDVNTGRRFNNLDRFFARGQALFETSDLTIRIIGDYAETDEQCCIAIQTQVGRTGAAINGLSALAGRTGMIANNDPSNRRVAITPGRDYAERVKDWGVSAEINYSFGDISLTSITAYRDWKARRNQDIDFSGLDRAYRDNYRTGMTDFTQELRLQGTAWEGKVDWLVGGFYLNETLTLNDRIQLGSQANQYVDALFAAGTGCGPGGACLSPGVPGGFSLFGSLGQPFFGAALAANPAFAPLVGAAPTQFGPAAFIPSMVGAGQVNDAFRVKTQGFGIFTHNIIEFSDQLSLTVGARYNRETKKFTANLNAVNPSCAALLPGGSSGVFGEAFRLAGLAPGGSALTDLRLLVCNPVVNPQFNGAYADERTEDEITGTARLAYKVNDDVLLFGAYSHGYKSGGYNLDRGGLSSTFFGGPAPSVSQLRFGKETVDAYEIGIKTNFSRAFQLNVTGFYQDFSGYQNLRFEGSSFVTRQYDEVISKGVEIESIIRPHRDLAFNIGYTRLSAVVNDPINARDDHDRQLTNQPKNVVTASATWTPRVSSDVGALFHVDARMNSDANTVNDVTGSRATTNDGYILLNARVGLDFMDGRFAVEAYVENALNTYYNITSFPVPEQTGTFAVYPGLPRFYGIKGKFRF